MRRFSEKSNNIIQGLMDYLAETGEERLLPEVSDELDYLSKESAKAEEIQVESTVLLSPEQKKIIQKFINSHLGQSLPVVNKINKAILGGFSIKVGDWYLDTSIKYQLKNIRHLLLR